MEAFRVYCLFAVDSKHPHIADILNYRAACIDAFDIIINPEQFSMEVRKMHSAVGI